MEPTEGGNDLVLQIKLSNWMALGDWLSVSGRRWDLTAKANEFCKAANFVFPTRLYIVCVAKTKRNLTLASYCLFGQRHGVTASSGSGTGWKSRIECIA